MKPHIYMQSGKWTVNAKNWPIFGFCLQASAYTYARSIWHRRKV